MPQDIWTDEPQNVSWNLFHFLAKYTAEWNILIDGHLPSQTLPLVGFV